MGIISMTLDDNLKSLEQAKIAVSTSNVTNFRVKITKIKRSQKKHYEKVRGRA
jgi:hypothetical protein